MSVESRYYVIAGYDLTGYETDKYSDWIWTDEGEAYYCNQEKGYIQLFEDPMNRSHLYFGCILAEGDEYSFETTKFDVETVNQIKENVENELLNLIKLGVISENVKPSLKYQVIAFEECS